MYYTELEQVRLTNGRFGIVEKIYFEMVDGEETDDVYCYEMNVDGISRCIVYPDEIAQ